MSVFHSLQVKKLNRLTDKSVHVVLDVPKSLQTEFGFKAGQYLTIKHQIDGEEIRRSYSICDAEPPKKGLFKKKIKASEVSFAVKEVEDGKMSTFLNKQLKEGDSLMVMEPTGKFLLPKFGHDPMHYVFIAAGSGITPVISQIKTVLQQSPEAEVILCFGNKAESEIMFKDELEVLEKAFINRFFVYHFWSSNPEEVKAPNVFNGRLKPSTVYKLSEKHRRWDDVHYFVCGPEEMIAKMEEYLPLRDVTKDQIHIEYFTKSKSEAQSNEAVSSDDVFETTIIFEGLEHKVDVPANTSILDVALKAGIHAPYSCQSGVCCTCQAKGSFGDFDTSECLSLSDDEIREGHVLTCVGKVVRDNVVINYDE